MIVLFSSIGFLCRLTSHWRTGHIEQKYFLLSVFPLTVKFYYLLLIRYKVYHIFKNNICSEVLLLQSFFRCIWFNISQISLRWNIFWDILVHHSNLGSWYFKNMMRICIVVMSLPLSAVPLRSVHPYGQYSSTDLNLSIGGSILRELWVTVIHHDCFACGCFTS